MSECNCCSCQYSTPPWWVTMGFVPPTNPTAAHATVVPAPVATTAQKPLTSQTISTPVSTREPTSSGSSSSSGGIGGVIGTILNPLGALGSLL